VTDDGTRCGDCSAGRAGDDAELISRFAPLQDAAWMLLLLLLLVLVVVVARAVMTTIINSVRSSSRPACDAARPPAFDSREARPLP